MYFKLLFIASLLLINVSENPDLTKIRVYFKSAGNSKADAEKLQTATSGQNTALITAYHGASWAIMAKHALNPYYKLNYLNKGTDIINRAVLKDAADIEIRFIRFSVEENIPAFISYKKHMKQDKEMIVKNLSSDHPNYEMIRSYLLNSPNISTDEKAKLN